MPARGGLERPHRFERDECICCLFSQCSNSISCSLQTSNNVNNQTDSQSKPQVNSSSTSTANWASLQQNWQQWYIHQQRTTNTQTCQKSQKSQNYSPHQPVTSSCFCHQNTFEDWPQSKPKRLSKQAIQSQFRLTNVPSQFANGECINWTTFWPAASSQQDNCRPWTY